MTGAVNIDREPGPSGEPDDSYLIHRFRSVHDADHRIIADYVYASRTHCEILSEQHDLRFANPSMIADALRRAGFQQVVVVNSPSISPFVIGAIA
jgi:hypothetical protein